MDLRRYVDTVRVLVAAGADLRLRSQRDQITPIEHATSKGYGRSHRCYAPRWRRTGPRSSWPTGACSLPPSVVTQPPRRSPFGPARVWKLATSKGRTPLLLAVTEDRLAVARLLVYLGADPDALDDQHDTPWLVTGVTGSVDMLEVLLPAAA